MTCNTTTITTTSTLAVATTTTITTTSAPFFLLACLPAPSWLACVCACGVVCIVVGPGRGPLVIIRGRYLTVRRWPCPPPPTPPCPVTSYLATQCRCLIRPPKLALFRHMRMAFKCQPCLRMLHHLRNPGHSDNPCSAMRDTHHNGILRRARSYSFFCPRGIVHVPTNQS
jgi:hypothetical protein